MTTRWRVQLRSKYTGSVVNLGETFETREQAERNATDEHACHRCNSVSVVPAYESEPQLIRTNFP